MNFLFYRYGSICEPDIIQAFHELGHDVTEITREITVKSTTPAETIELVSDLLLKKHFHGVFSINYYPALSEVCNVFHIPYICWTVDSPVLELYSHTLSNSYNRIFLFDNAQYQEFAPQNPNGIFHLPLAANVSRFDAVISSAPTCRQQSFSHDISFVGSLYTEKCPYDSLSIPSDYTRGYLESLMTAQEKIYGSYFIEECLDDKLVNEIISHNPDFYTVPENTCFQNKSVLAQYYIGNKITSQERIHVLTLLGNHFPVHIYTKSNTSGLPLINCGSARSHTEMPLIFHNSKINLNITSRSIRSGIPLRVFDVLACGGFLITNYQPELEEFFTPGSDIVVYSDISELVDLVHYYLLHEEERKKIAKNGYQKLRSFHTYTQRLAQMLYITFCSA